MKGSLAGSLAGRDRGDVLSPLLGAPCTRTIFGAGRKHGQQPTIRMPIKTPRSSAQADIAINILILSHLFWPDAGQLGQVSESHPLAHWVRVGPEDRDAVTAHSVQ